MSFGSRFRAAREEKHLSQQELADLINATDGTISNYEKGVAFPRWDTMRRLCDILDVEPNYLFWDELSDKLKSKIMNQITLENNDNGILLYKQLDAEDKAEIRGEMKQMLKADKYTNGENVNNTPKRKLFSSPPPARIAASGMEVRSVENLKNKEKN